MRELLKSDIMSLYTTLLECLTPESLGNIHLQAVSILALAANANKYAKHSVILVHLSHVFSC